MSSGASSRLGTFTISETFQSFDSLKNIRNLSLDANRRAVIEQPDPHWMSKAWAGSSNCCCNGKPNKPPKCTATTFGVLVQILNNLKEQNLETFKTDIQTKRIFCNLNRDQRTQVVNMLTQNINPTIVKASEKNPAPSLPVAPTPVVAVPDVRPGIQKAEQSPSLQTPPVSGVSTPSIVSFAQLYAFKPQKKRDDSDSSGEESTHRPAQKPSIVSQQDYERAMEMLAERNRPAQPRKPVVITSPPQQAPLTQSDQDALRRRPLQSTKTRVEEIGAGIPNFGIKVLPDDKTM